MSDAPITPDAPPCYWCAAHQYLSSALPCPKCIPPPFPPKHQPQGDGSACAECSKPQPGDLSGGSIEARMMRCAAAPSPRAAPPIREVCNVKLTDPPGPILMHTYTAGCFYERSDPFPRAGPACSVCRGRLDDGLSSCTGDGIGGMRHTHCAAAPPAEAAPTRELTEGKDMTSGSLGAEPQTPTTGSATECDGKRARRHLPRHIIRSHGTLAQKAGSPPCLTWCGQSTAPWVRGTFISVDHASGAAIEREPFTPCPNCAAAIVAAFAPFVHASDCAVHNEPAYPNGPCDCPANTVQPTPTARADE